MSPTRRGFSRRALAALVGSVGVAIGLSWLVGTFGSDGPFDWELASVFGTAVGTTLLAITTAGMAYLTGREVSATKELAELTRADQVARDEPVVLLHVAVYRPEAG